MKLTKRILITLTSAFVTLGLVTAPALVSAADDEVTNENIDTGSRSTNRNRTRINREQRTRQHNSADARNHVDVHANTGGNEQNKNTNADGNQESGEVHVIGTLTNDLNQDIPDIDMPDDDNFIVDNTNDTTGANSRNANRTTIRTSRSLRIHNDANAHNSVDVHGTTGNNEQNKNTNAGDQTSGDVTVDLMFDNILN